jgi:hypothetical protein
MTSLRRQGSIETKQSSHLFAFLSIDCIVYICICIYECMYENRRIKRQAKKIEKKRKKERIYTDLFGLVIVDDNESDEDLFVSIDDRC